MTDKSPDAYRTISEVAEDLDLPQHVLRFWETRFSQIRPLKRGGGRRYYRPDDVELLKGIRYLLYSEGYTIKGVQRILKEQGPRAVQVIVQGAAGEPVPQKPGGHRVAQDDPVHDPVHDPVDDPDDGQAWGEPPADWTPEDEPVAAPAPAFMPAPAPPVVAPPPPVARPMPAQPPEPDLFAEPLPVAPVVAPPPAAPAPAAPPNVSFLRGGLSKSPAVVKPAPVPAKPVEEPRVFVRRPPQPVPPPEPPAKRFSPLVEEEADPQPAEPEASVAVPAAIVSPRGLTDEQRRALQSVLFELQECRRAVEKISVLAAR